MSQVPEKTVGPIYTYKECYDLINSAPGCTPESDFAFEWARYNYMKFSEYTKFDELIVDDLLELIFYDDVNVVSENTLFDTVLKWLQLFLQKNKELNTLWIPELMRRIRIAAASPRYLIDVIEPVCFEAPECRRYFHSAIIWHMLPWRRENMDDHFTIPRSYFARVLAVGGWHQDTCGIIEEYDTESETWTQLKTMKIRKNFYGVGLVRDKLMLTGGKEKGKPVKTVDSYDFVTGELKSEEPMNEARDCPGLIVLDYEYPITIYAIGGGGETGTLNTVEKWDEKSRKWTYVASMNHTREGFGVAAVNNIIYACGGRYGSEYRNSLELYDPKTNEWTMKASMCRKRTYFKMATVGGCIYALGGFGMTYGILGLNTWERYDPKADEWTEMPKMKFSAAIGPGVMAGQLFYVGGGSNAQTSKDGEIFDENKREWNAIAPLNVSRDGITIVNVPYNLLNTKFLQ